MISRCSTYRFAFMVTFWVSVFLISYNFANVAGLLLFSVSWKPLCSSPSCCSLSWTKWVICPKPRVFAFNSDSVISFVARSFVAILCNSMFVSDDKTPKLCIFWITFSSSLVSCLLLDRLVSLWSLECSRSSPYIDLVSIDITDLRLKERVYLFRVVILVVIPTIPPPRLPAPFNHSWPWSPSTWLNLPWPTLTTKFPSLIQIELVVAACSFLLGKQCPS